MKRTKNENAGKPVPLEQRVRPIPSTLDEKSMVLGTFDDKTDFDPNHAYSIIDKAKTPEKYQQTLYVFMNTQQARVIRDELERLINEEPRDDFAAHLKIYTGLN